MKKVSIISKNQAKVHAFLARFLLVCVGIAVFAAIAVGMSSCNVTRRVTTEQVYTQKGDTAVSITTRTIETYDARKNLK